MYARVIAAISANRRLWITLLVFAALPLLIRTAWTSTSAQPTVSSGQEREFKLHREYKDLPLEFHVKNLQSKDWLKDLEVEIKNVGKKPIYSVLAYLIFPDDKRAEEVGIPLDYGNPKNVRLDRYAEAMDPHIDPGDVYVFKIDEDLQQGFDSNVKEHPEAYKKFELLFEIISFGDGTGLVNGGSQDYRKSSSIPTTLDEKKKSPHH